MLVSMESLRVLGRGPGFFFMAVFSVSLGFILAFYRPMSLQGFAWVVGAAVGFVTAGGAIKAVAEARNGHSEMP